MVRLPKVNFKLTLDQVQENNIIVYREDIVNLKTENLDFNLFEIDYKVLIINILC